VHLSLFVDKYRWNWIDLFMLLSFLSLIVADPPKDQNNANIQVHSVFMENTFIISSWVAVFAEVQNYQESEHKSF